MEKRGLGRGINALIPQRQEVTEKEKVAFLALDQVRPNPFQPRKEIDPKNLEELVQSIKENGIIQPVLVRRKADGYELIAGERRFTAAKVLKLKEIPAIIREATDEESLELALIENIQRQNLNPIEKAKAYQYLIALAVILLGVLFVIWKADSVAVIADGFFNFFGNSNSIFNNFFYL